MSTKVIVQVQMTDDLDGETEAAETVLFGWRGTWYEIDLSKEHLGELGDFLEPFVKAGRRADAKLPPVTVHGGGHMDARRFNAACREWGKQNGWPEDRLAPGLAIPRKLRQAYLEHLAGRSLGGR